MYFKNKEEIKGLADKKNEFITRTTLQEIPK